MERPASHQGTDRPEAKNSAVLFPALFPKNKDGPKQSARDSATITQSQKPRLIRYPPRINDRKNIVFRSGYSSVKQKFPAKLARALVFFVFSMKNGLEKDSASVYINIFYA
jgi:hypothetical protein